MGFLKTMSLGAVIGVEITRATMAGLSTAGRALGTFQTQLSHVGTAVQGFGRLAGQFSLFASVATAGLLAAAGAGLNAAATFEQTEIAFTTMLGSAEEMRRFLGELQEFAKVTPFEFTDLTRAARRMKAMGFETESILPIMTDLGNAIAAMGGGAEMIDRATLAFGQMRTKGRVMSQEMNQLTETGIFGWQNLADHLGKTTRETMKMVEDGQVSAATAMNAFRVHSQKHFGGAMAAQSKTFLGIISNMKDAAGFAIRDLFRPMLEEMKPAMTELMGFMGSFGSTPMFAEFGKGMAEGVRILIQAVRWAGLFVAALFPAGTFTAETARWLGKWAVLGTVILGGLGLVAGAFAAIVAVVSAVIAALAPLVPIISSVFTFIAGLSGTTLAWGAAFAAAIGVIVSYWDIFKSAFLEVVNQNGAGSAFIAGFQILRSVFNDIVAGVQNFLALAAPGFKILAKTLGQLAGWFVTILGYAFALGAFLIKLGGMIFRFVIAPVAGFFILIASHLVEIIRFFVNGILNGIAMVLRALVDNPVVKFALEKMGVQFGEFKPPKLFEGEGNPLADVMKRAAELDASLRAQSSTPDVNVDNKFSGKLEVEVPINIDGKKVGTALAERQIELTERAGFSITPYQRRSIRERGGDPVTGT